MNQISKEVDTKHIANYNNWINNNNQLESNHHCDDAIDNKQGDDDVSTKMVVGVRNPTTIIVAKNNTTTAPTPAADEKIHWSREQQDFFGVIRDVVDFYFFTLSEISPLF